MKRKDDDLWNDADGDPLDLKPSRPRSSKSESSDGDRHIGCPVWWVKLALPATGGAKLAVALYLYRLRVVRRSKTVTVSNDWLRDELGISRFMKYRALADLARAKLIKLHPRRGKEACKITFLR